MTAQPTRLFLFTLVAATALGPLAMQIFVPALPLIQVDYEVTPGTAQLALSLSMVAIAVSTLVYGPLSDRFGRRPMLILGLWIFLAGSAICSLAPTIELLILGRIVQAIGGTSGMVLSRAMVRDVYAHEKVASVLAAITIAMVVAPMLAPAIGGILSDLFGWRAIFSFAGAVCIGVLLLVNLYLTETGTRPPTHVGVTGMIEGFAMLLRSPAFCGYAFAGAFGLSGFFSFVAAAPYLMVNSLGRPPTEYGLFFVSISLSFMAGNAVAARISERVGIDRMIFLGNAVALLGVGIMLALSLAGVFSPLSIFAPTGIMVFGNGLAMANLQAGALGIYPRSAGTASGLSGFLQMSIAAGFAQIVGVLQDGSPLPMAVFMFATVLMAFLTFLIALRANRRAEAGTA